MDADLVHPIQCRIEYSECPKTARLLERPVIGHLIIQPRASIDIILLTIEVSKIWTVRKPDGTQVSKHRTSLDFGY